MEKAKEILDYLKCSVQERKDHEAYKESLHYQASLYETNYTAAKIEGRIEGRIEGEQIGIVKGEQIGIAKGEQNSKMAMAKSMLRKGLAVEMIAEITGLTQAQILS